MGCESSRSRTGHLLHNIRLQAGIVAIPSDYLFAACDRCFRMRRQVYAGSRRPNSLMVPRLQYRDTGNSRCELLNLMVGAAGFEPTTSCLPDKRANRAAPRPDGPIPSHKARPSHPFIQRRGIVAGVVQNAGISSTTPARSVTVSRRAPANGPLRLSAFARAPARRLRPARASAAAWRP